MPAEVAEQIGARSPHVLYLVPPGFPVEVFRSRCPKGWTFDSLSDSYSRDEVKAKLGSADFVIQSSVVQVGPDDLVNAARLRLIARQGVGVDKLDLDEFARMGVRVTICPEGTTEAVAEHTLMLMLAAARHLTQLHADVREKDLWPKTAYRHLSIGLHGNKVAVVGYGRIGRAVVNLLVSFGAQPTVVVRPHRLEGLRHDDPGVRFTSDLYSALSGSSFVTLHVPLTNESQGLIGARELATMSGQAFVINTSRGELIDQAALVAALDDGSIAGAALDVAATEPPPAGDPIRTHPRVLLTPHVAAGTRDSLMAKAEAIYTDLERVWAGGEPLNPVN